MAYVAWIGKYDKEDSILVALLRKAGAVFYVKTSVPQSLMVCETINNIIGRTVNPRNKNWSCGGSSGGEGANVGFRGGIIGVGTDIGRVSFVALNAWANVFVRWFHSSPLRLQFPLWPPPESWAATVRQNGQ